MWWSVNMETNARYYSQTDSLCIAIQTDDWHAHMQANLQYFDTSNLQRDHDYSPTKNHRVLGKFKSETGSLHPVEFVGLKAKMYSLDVCPKKATLKWLCSRSVATAEEYNSNVWTIPLNKSCTRDCRNDQTVWMHLMINATYCRMVWTLWRMITMEFVNKYIVTLDFVVNSCIYLSLLLYYDDYGGVNSILLLCVKYHNIKTSVLRICINSTHTHTAMMENGMCTSIPIVSDCRSMTMTYEHNLLWIAAMVMVSAISTLTVLILLKQSAHAPSPPQPVCSYEASEWVSSFLTAHKHNLGHLVPLQVKNQERKSNIITKWKQLPRIH